MAALPQRHLVVCRLLNTLQCATWARPEPVCKHLDTIPHFALEELSLSGQDSLSQARGCTCTYPAGLLCWACGDDASKQWPRHNDHGPGHHNTPCMLWGVKAAGQSTTVIHTPPTRHVSAVTHCQHEAVVPKERNEVSVSGVCASRPHPTHPNRQPQLQPTAPVRHPQHSCRHPPHLCCYCCWRRRRSRALAPGCCRGGPRLALRLAAGPALPHTPTASDRLQQQQRRGQSCPACCCRHWSRCWRRRGACSSC